MHTSKIQLFRDAFETHTGFIHLNNAGATPTCIPTLEEVQRVLQLEAQRGCHELEDTFAIHDQARLNCARFLGTVPENLAFMPGCAAALSQVALGFPFKAGDEILTWDQEYPSNAYPWMEATRKTGAILKRVASLPDFSIDLDEMIQALTPRTKIVAVSWVQFQTGAVTDLKKLSEACHAQDTWLVVDGIQGLGHIPFNMDELGVDAICTGTHKWLCGPWGAGLLGIRPELRDLLTPILQGAVTYDNMGGRAEDKRTPVVEARKFEPGMCNIITEAGLSAALGLLKTTSLEAIHAHCMELKKRLITGLKDRKIHVLSQMEWESSIVTFLPPDVEASTARLNDAGISYALRAGGIRLSPHGFNTAEEIDRALEVV